MLETLIVVLLVLWLLGFFGRRRIPRLRSERRAIAYFHPSARTRAIPATRWVTYKIEAAVSGRSHATIPDARSVAIAASSARFARRRGTSRC